MHAWNGPVAEQALECIAQDTLNSEPSAKGQMRRQLNLGDNLCIAVQI